ncbi:MAG: YhbY family RNA-binding protein [Planctomycetota bacterium]|jgi:RNA-binding protein
MTDLTGKQKRFLRSCGQQLRPAAIVGKAGLTDDVVAHLADQLARHELVKIKLPAGDERKAIAAESAEKLGAVCIGVVGRTALLYRANDQLDPSLRIDLP